MRIVARYAFETSAGELAEAERWIDRVKQKVDDWLLEKGELHADGGLKLTLPDGRIAKFTDEKITVDGGNLQEWILKEPIQAGVFETTVRLARFGNDISFYCVLGVGSPRTVMSPVSFEVRCPRIVGHVLSLTVPWRVGRTRIDPGVRRFSGVEGGRDLFELMTDNTRDIPIVVASEHQGFLFHPQLDEALAKDLCGLAQVATLDSQASWELTTKAGAPWSCFNGAIRVYWPNLDLASDPFKHPLWTADRLLYRQEDHEAASNRIRNYLRRKLISTSAFAVRTPETDQLVELRRREELRDTDNYDALLSLADKENKALLEENESLRARIARLEQDNENLLVQLDHARSPGLDAVDVEAESQAPPTTVQEAVDRARQEFSDFLIFGDDVDEAVETLVPDAGPPDKVLRYLKTLSDMARARSEGSLGTNVVAWLKEQNCVTSTESDTIKNNPTEMEKRHWHDGTESRRFTLHMKPSEATSPDRCVRIYFDYDVDLKKVIVGWVGRHP